MAKTSKVASAIEDTTKVASAIEDTTKVATRKRINLDLPSSAHEDLLRLTGETGKNMAEVLRIGLSLYLAAHQARKKGQSLGIVQGDRVIKEIVIAS
jgi:hypothetical protein